MSLKIAVEYKKTKGIRERTEIMSNNDEVII